MVAKDALLTRLNKIENELRFWRFAGTCAILGMFLVITVAATSKKDVPDVIQAREFQLVGLDGTIRAELKVAEVNNTRLRMYDGSGKSEVSITANEQRAIVSLKHDNKTNKAVMEAHNLGADVSLLKETKEGKTLTHISGGSEGSFVMTAPLKGVETYFPEKK